MSAGPEPERHRVPHETREPERAVALVCIHGLAGSSRWWARVAPLLEAAGAVVPLDLPRSLPPPDLPAWVGEQVEVLQGRGPVDVAGHSLGALIALRLAASRPDLVRKLILVAPPGITPRGSVITFGWPLLASLSRARPEFLLRVARDATRAGPANVLRGASYVAAADSRKDASRVSAPTLVVWGARDRLAPSDTRAHWLLALPNAEIHVIPNAGHVPMIETPAELAAVIRTFRSEGEN